MICRYRTDVQPLTGTILRLQLPRYPDADQPPCNSAHRGVQHGDHDLWNHTADHTTFAFFYFYVPCFQPLVESVCFVNGIIKFISVFERIEDCEQYC